MRSGRLTATLALLAVLEGPAGAARETRFVVDPEVGNNTFTAVFDSQIGERITAVSSAVQCTLTVDEARLEGRAHCSLPLSSVRVDNDDTKTEHFGQWATNKKMEPARCAFDLDVPAVNLSPPVEAKKAAVFTTEGTFTICGRPRDDRRPERIQGTVLYLPAGTYGSKRTLRIRARIEHFDRERYGPRTPRAGSRASSSSRTWSGPRERSTSTSSPPAPIRMGARRSSSSGTKPAPWGRRIELKGGPRMNAVGRGMLIASAAAALVLGGNVAARATDKTGTEVHCAGINECKGKGSCAGAENACKSKNACKGKGYIDVSSAEECVKKGGKVIEPKKM